MATNDRVEAAPEDDGAVDETLTAIARRYLGVPTLETRDDDRLDFHEVSAWTLRRTLRAAYDAGREA